MSPTRPEGAYILNYSLNRQEIMEIVLKRIAKKNESVWITII